MKRPTFARYTSIDSTSISDSPLAKLAGALVGIPLLENAACRGLSPQFDYVQEGEDPIDARRRRQLALRVCLRCEALAACRAELEASEPGQFSGVVAGIVIRERGAHEEAAVLPVASSAFCGTIEGVNAHRRAEEPLCPLCRPVRAQDRKQRRRRTRPACRGCGKTYIDAYNVRRHQASGGADPGCAGSGVVMPDGEVVSS